MKSKGRFQCRQYKICICRLLLLMKTVSCHHCRSSGLNSLIPSQFISFCTQLADAPTLFDILRFAVLSNESNFTGLFKLLPTASLIVKGVKGVLDHPFCQGMQSLHRVNVLSVCLSFPIPFFGKLAASEERYVVSNANLMFTVNARHRIAYYISYFMIYFVVYCIAYFMVFCVVYYCFLWAQLFFPKRILYTYLRAYRRHAAEFAGLHCHTTHFLM